MFGELFRRVRAVAQWNVCRKHEAREAQVRSQGVAGETDMGRV